MRCAICGKRINNPDHNAALKGGERVHKECAKDCMMMDFVIPVYNAEKYIRKCIESVKSQGNTNWRLFIINDASTDNTLHEIYSAVHDIDYGKYVIIENDKRKRALYNINYAIRNHCNDDSVVAILDGDDWLAHNNVIDIILEQYAEKDYWIVWTQHVDYPTNDLGGSSKILDNVSIRKAANIGVASIVPGTRASAMRTFRKRLYDHINEDDLKDVDGEIYKWVYDQAMTFPMLEMAGPERRKFINNLAYVYNRENNLSINSNEDMRFKHRSEQNRISKHIKDRKPYKELKNLDVEPEYIIKERCSMQEKIIEKEDNKTAQEIIIVPRSKKNIITYMVGGQVRFRKE